MSETPTPTPEELEAKAAEEAAAAAAEASAEEAKVKKEAAAAQRAEKAAAKKAAEADAEEVTFICKKYPQLAIVTNGDLAGKELQVQFTEQDPEINEITNEPIRMGLLVTSDPALIAHIEALDASYGIRRA